jgi:hypothetical protein
MQHPLSLFGKTPAGVAVTRKTLRRLAMVTALLAAPVVLGVQGASADTQIFRDVLRPHGVARSQAQKIADGRACGASADNTFTHAAAFRKCMRARGWVLERIVPDAPPSSGASPSYIDPETGMECHNAGIAAICDPPSGTVYYYNKHGRPCRRTGLLAVCT